MEPAITALGEDLEGVCPVGLLVNWCRAQPYTSVVYFEAAPGGGPSGCGEQAGGCSTLQTTVAMRQPVPVLSSVNTSTPQWDHLPSE